jgi:hypothetical protein
LLIGGAEYKVDESGEKRLEVTKDQLDSLEKINMKEISECLKEISALLVSRDSRGYSVLFGRDSAMRFRDMALSLESNGLSSAEFSTEFYDEVHKMGTEANGRLVDDTESLGQMIVYFENISKEVQRIMEKGASNAELDKILRISNNVQAALNKKLEILNRYLSRPL